MLMMEELNVVAAPNDVATLTDTQMHVLEIAAAIILMELCFC
jgi:hypothetical protein